MGHFASAMVLAQCTWDNSYCIPDGWESKINSIDYLALAFAIFSLLVTLAGVVLLARAFVLRSKLKERGSWAQGNCNKKCLRKLDITGWVFVILGLAMLISSLTIGISLRLYGIGASYSDLVELTHSEPLHHDVTSLTSLRVAFIGDTGASAVNRDLYQLLRNESVQLIIHLGDFDYRDRPDVFDNNLNSIFGETFPVLAVAGNHDVLSWIKRPIFPPYDDSTEGYQDKLKRRLERTNNIACSGRLGGSYWCVHQGVFFTFVSAAMFHVSPEEAIAQLTESFKQKQRLAPSSWSVCVWHKNRRALQVGDKYNDAPIELYETCRKQGALIVNAHNHAYARSFPFTNFKTMKIWKNESNIGPYNVGCKRTPVVISGLGGFDVEPLTEMVKRSHWARTCADPSLCRAGALICTYEPMQVDCTFITTTGSRLDNFTLINDPSPEACSPSPVPVPDEWSPSLIPPSD